MIATARRRLLRRLRDERGFTLVELLVAMSMGIVVSTAALGIVIISGQLSSNYQDRIDANQQGRLAMERVTQALGSSCFAASVTPVLAGSSATQIWFYTSNKDIPEIIPTEDTISIQSNALLLTSYTTTGAGGTWTLNTTGPTNFTLLQFAGLATVNGVANTPLFQYYDYNPIGQPALIPLSGAATLTAAQAATVVMVTVSFRAYPTDDYSTNNRTADFTDSVILRLSPASTAAGASNSPCT
jgi:Tfp pilus assembly protein PilW